MLTTCPECDLKVSDKALSCPHCGFPMAKKESLKTSRKKARKYPKLPNGFGSIKKLSGNRTNPYAVIPAVTEFDSATGKAIQPTAIAYVKDWYTGFGVLSAYNAGKYKPGDEIIFDDSQITDAFVNDIISAYNYGISARKSDLDKKFSEVYEMYVEWDFKKLETETDAKAIKRLKDRKRSMKAAYNQCASIHDAIFRNLRHSDLQHVIDICPKKSATKENIVVLYHKMYKFADIQDIQKENHSKYVTVENKDDDEHGVPFTNEELKILWQNKNDPVIEFVLIMCLSGFRIIAYKDIEVNLEQGYFKGGVKTRNGIERIVPIHSSIFEMVKKRMERDGCMLNCTDMHFRTLMYRALEKIGIPKHTPHDCRDTFATLADQAKIDKFYLKRLIGHSLKSDLTEDKYIHPSLESLKKEIEKINLLPIVANDS